ncbi:MAG: extracellular solute-binding protein [Chitinophagaceae bacterium]|nr:extracellular solute-binding protein [Chitinophagaceae bacterium]
MEKIELKGITWGHSRGYTPLVACAQRYSELHPQINITWKKRTLQEFADFPIEQLVHDYDLLIIDHPWVGCAAATKCVLPLDQYVSAAFLEDQLKHTVGFSHQSYQYGGHQWALAIDAATPVASYRKDLLEKNNTRLPARWDEVIALAEKGKIAVPGIPIDLLMNFYMFCVALGIEPFSSREEVVDNATGKEVLQMMKALWGRVDGRMFSSNPIAVAEIMSSTDDYWYCPFAYGYSNYSRKGYASHLLHYADLVSMEEHKLCSTLGGTGIAVSATSSHPAEAVQFAAWIASPGIQATLYAETGGQPGHRLAWEDEQVNHYTNGYFINTLPALDRAYVRPRYNGYLHFQDRAGAPIQQYLQYGGDAQSVLNDMNLLYRSSLKQALV